MYLLAVDQGWVAAWPAPMMGMQAKPSKKFRQ
jgi:hypothetical protein